MGGGDVVFSMWWAGIKGGLLSGEGSIYGNLQ